MTIKQQGGIFGRNPTFNDVEIKGELTAGSIAGVEIGSDVQAYDAGLASIAGLTTAADKMIYTTASDTYAVADLTSAGRAILDDADAAAQRTTLGLGTIATQNDDNISISEASLIRGEVFAATGNDGSQTSIIDTGINVSVGDSQIYLCTISGNPNQGGNGNYKANAVYIINITSDYTFSSPASITVNIKETKLAFDTGAVGTELTLDAKLWDGSSEADFFRQSAGAVEIRLKVGLYNSSFVGSNQNVRLLRLL